MATLVCGLETACLPNESVKEEKEKEDTCTVCMEITLEKNQCTRPCGHMMCATCDVAWQSRGKIQEFKMQRQDKKDKENIMVYMTVSSCPSCRRKDEPHDYRSRSKVSMFHEIQFLTRTLYLSGIRIPMTYASQFNEMNEATVVTTPPPPLLRRLTNVFSPYVPSAPVASPVAAPFAAPVAAPVAAPFAAVASVSQNHVISGLPPVPPSFQTTGICCRRREGMCYTTRTKLKCSACNRFLCRSCRGSGCVCHSL